MQKHDVEETKAALVKIKALTKAGMPIKEACEKVGIKYSYYYFAINNKKYRAAKKYSKKNNIISVDKETLGSLNDTITLKKQLAAAFSLIETLKPQL